MYLNTHTYYSLRYGTFSVKELCELAGRNKATAVALTDINNTSACLSFLKMAAEYEFTPLTGVDFRNGVQQQYVGLARNNAGFKQLNDHLSAHLHAEKSFKKDAPGLPDCYLIYPLEKVIADKKTTFRENEFIGVSVESLRKLKFSGYLRYREKLVLLQTVSFRSKKDFNAHRLLRAIDNNVLLSKLSQSEQGCVEHQMLPPGTIEAAFEDHLHILENTQNLIAGCKLYFGFGKARLNRNLQVFGNSREEDAESLKALCIKNLPRRYPNASEAVYARVNKELEAIISLGFVSYFLINHDIVEYARSRNYPFIGRGSGANSVVAYIIGITNVDPIELDLYFERFINAHRHSPPDFDIDFSWKDREDVTAYIFNKYENTALLATYVTFKRRAVIRELGKVFGLPKAEIDKLSAGFFKIEDLDEMEKLVFRYSYLIAGFPNYLSVHAGGIMILQEPVHNYAATFLPPKGFATIQFDMHVAEDVGIFKFDILAQRGLSKITDAIEIIKQNQPGAVVEDMENVSVFKNDPNVNHLLRTGDCMGVFYVESPAMRGLFIKLQTEDYLGLVAASSIIRPGVSNGGMKEEYIKRHRDPERRKQAHPVMYEIMPDTYGIMVYQEDVLKVAHFFAGLSLEEADVLRRGMSGKKLAEGEFDRLEAKFRSNCREKGYSEQLVEEVWNQVLSFAGYAFPKGHSASYAVESYQSLYLKYYFPLEFMVACLNNGGGFYDVETYIQEIRKCGGRVHAPCINKSDHHTVIYGKDVYLGLGYIKELEIKVVQHILENRNFFGPFSSFDDFIDRVPVSIEQLSILLKIDAFRFTGVDKHHLLWKAFFKLSRSKTRTDQQLLFRPPHRDFELPELAHSFLIDAYDQMELLGFSLHDHFRLLKNPMKNSAVKAADLQNFVGKEIEIYGNLITAKRTATVNREYMVFGTFFDPAGDIFDTVQFPRAAERFPLHSKGIYLCRGKVVNELGYLSVTINRIERQETVGDPRFVNSAWKALPA
ncbi:DNA polymerase III subunit alpha [Salinimicrobium flavum]|uniref:DNA-directed DNA polymerase n=1 Tax=Salinimicrobium flavum TaxID=1737065 RepID=A0ABW5IVU2_9FLAO